MTAHRLIKIAAFIAVICLFAATLAIARDLGQWENTDPELRIWFQALRQPDNPNISCCGEADAYWADRVEVVDGKTFAIITDTREDAPLRRPHIEVGTKVEIPPNKFGPGKWGNPTGHTVIFINPYNLSVYCYVQGTGT